MRLTAAGHLGEGSARCRQCSDCRRWALPGALTLTATKRLLGTAAGAGANGACMRYCGHRASANPLVLRHGPLPHHLNWRFRPSADFKSGECAGRKRSSATPRKTACGRRFLSAHRVDRQIRWRELSRPGRAWQPVVSPMRQRTPDGRTRFARPARRCYEAVP